VLLHQSAALGKHYTGYQLKKGKEEDRALDTIMKDISQMNVTSDGICQTAKKRQELRSGKYGPPNVLVTGRTKVR